MLANTVRRVVSTRVPVQMGESILAIASGSKCGIEVATNRNFFTRHVPEPRMQIHLPVTPEAEPLDSIVLQEKGHDEKKPVVLIIGWAGANPKHIDKYVKIYNDEGYRVVSLCPPCYHYSIPNSRVGFYISPLFRAIDAKPGDFRSFADCPIVIHSFSMNGVRGIVSFWKWTEAEEKPELRERIKGVIFDSAPSRPYGKQDATAMVISTPSIDSFDRFVTEQTRITILTWFLNLRGTLQIPILALLPFVRSFMSIYYYLQDHIKLPKEQLYLYSKTDTMIKARHVEKFIAKQKEKGANVTSIDFGESEHVAHIRTDPEQYREACLNFLKRIEAIYK